MWSAEHCRVSSQSSPPRGAEVTRYSEAEAACSRAACAAATAAAVVTALDLLFMVNLMFTVDLPEAFTITPRISRRSFGFVAVALLAAALRLSADSGSQLLCCQV